ncbi:methyltransferase [Devosia sp.]|uniref:class I SAM-dependent methyltransferase n=1 Tax=Devosia sp. TaxID=1871048 RepID=UPI0025F1A91A|nr:50S ribosomal protein L11 methyltransferase [Devosia sp.]MCR6637072.1 50S ribosomal protein L11 methyltransferase [Devosia sp.]
MPASGVSLSPEEFIRQRFTLAPLPFRPDISLYRPTPQSGLIGFLAAQGRADEPPYWAYAWAGGAVLALYLQDHPEIVAGKTVLDFGAGSGLVGIAAARAGATKIWAIEPDSNAHAAMMLNAEANGAAIASWNEHGLPEVDIILAGDVFYDTSVTRQTLPILAAAATHTKILVGDPFRRDLPLDHLDLLAEYTVPDMGGGAPVRSGVFALRPGNIGNAP